MKNLRFIATALVAAAIPLTAVNTPAYADTSSQDLFSDNTTTYHDYSKDYIADSNVIPKSTKETIFNMINTVVYENENLLDPNSFKDLTNYKGVLLNNSIRLIEYTGDDSNLYSEENPNWEGSARGILAYRDAVKNNINYSITDDYTITDNPCTMYQIQVNDSTCIYVNMDTSEIYVKSINRENFESFVAFKNGIKTLSKYRLRHFKAINSFPFYTTDYVTEWIPLTSDWLTYTYSEDWKNHCYLYTMNGNDWHYTTDTDTLYIKNGLLHDGWTKINGSWHYFAANIPITHMRWTIDDKEYFFDENGVWQTGWIHYKGAWFYFYPDGDFAKDTYIDGYYLNADGDLCENHGTEYDACLYL